MAPSKEDQHRLGNYAAMLDEDENIDRHFCHRVVPMQVLSLGFSRTGTMCTFVFKLLPSYMATIKDPTDQY